MKTVMMALLLSALPMTAVAAQTHALPDHLAKMDTNKDGKVSLEEFSIDPPKVFKLLDANRDGIVSRDEATAFYTKIAPADDPKTVKRIGDITAADTNGDGTSLAEMMAARAAAFKQRDKNNDGVLTGDDF